MSSESAENLVTHLDTRTAGGDWGRPIIGWDGATLQRVSYESCYRTSNVQLAEYGNQFILTIDLLDKYLVDGFLLV